VSHRNFDFKTEVIAYNKLADVFSASNVSQSRRYLGKRELVNW
jgi:hypothetical protein